MEHVTTLQTSPGEDALLNYNPGLHILAELATNDSQLLSEHLAAKEFFNNRISQYGLNPLGEVWHNFPGGGYTGVICLTESHIAVHTWPEHGIVTFDVYLSNFRKNNDETTRKMFNETVAFFKAHSYNYKEVKR